MVEVDVNVSVEHGLTNEFQFRPTAKTENWSKNSATTHDLNTLDLINC